MPNKQQSHFLQQGNIVALVLVVLLVMSWLGINNLRGGVMQTQLSHHQSLMQQVAMTNEAAIDCALQSLPKSLQQFTQALPDYLQPSTQQGCRQWLADQPFQPHGFDAVTSITRQQFCGEVSGASWLNSDVDVFAAQRFQLLAKSQTAAPQIISITDQQIWERLVAASPQQLAQVGVSTCAD
jgi:hypothetical protein